MHRPAGMKSHQEPTVMAPCSLAERRSCPQVGMLGSPMPRKARVDSEIIAFCTSRMIFEKIRGKTLGKICFLIIYASLAPSALALST